MRITPGFFNLDLSLFLASIFKSRWKSISAFSINKLVVVDSHYWTSRNLKPSCRKKISLDLTNSSLSFRVDYNLDLTVISKKIFLFNFSEFHRFPSPPTTTTSPSISASFPTLSVRPRAVFRVEYKTINRMKTLCY